MNNTIKFYIDNKHINERVDIFLTKKLEKLTRSYIKKLILAKQVKINDKFINSPSIKLKINDNLCVNIVEKTEQKLLSKNIKLNVVFEDNDLLIIDKPKGMVVHPGAGNYDNTLVNALLFKYKNKLSNINGNLRPGIVHRIDKDTSGLLVVAKNNFTHSDLSKQFSEHSIKRKYQCLIWGILRPLNGRIETLITRNKKNRQLMTVSDFKGKRAVTNYRTIKTFTIKNIPKISLVECELETGRTHQIRVHMKHKGASLLGDNQYGKKNLKFKKINSEFETNLMKLSGQALHAKTLEFIHPTQKKIVKFKSEPPIDFKKMLNLLKNLSC